MTIKFVGADASDSGPAGLIGRFLEAAASHDMDAARDMLTEGSREGFAINPEDFENVKVRIGEIEGEDGAFLVRTELTDDEGPTEMPFILSEENGELRINFDATLAGLMGGSPERILEQLIESRDTEGE